LRWILKCVCRLQAHSELASVGSTSTAINYTGPMDVARHILRYEGGVRGFFKGMCPTMARQVLGNAVMFGVYEALKQHFAGGMDISGLGRGSLIVAGGLAGGLSWFAVNPADVIKSVIQVDDYRNSKYSGFFYALKKILALEGVKGLYKGFGPAIACSVPANVTIYVKGIS
ncbi:mitochondrial carnitine/acylcarnitine carrier-like protein, partial [Solanum dulcamara]|uniref:mitochondrial carnitine/acylcarnitine carrier-like protein n=1 Tax=Solanum dulcamara TaxID=45834 RepID=UPI002486840D